MRREGNLAVFFPGTTDLLYHAFFLGFSLQGRTRSEPISSVVGVIVLCSDECPLGMLAYGVGRIEQF